MNNNFSDYSEDSLCNGIHQSYIGHDDELYLWNNNNTTRINYPYESSNPSIQTNYELTVLTSQYKCDAIPDDEVGQYASSNNTTITTWQPSEEISHLNYNQDWELNIENLLLENCLDYPDWQQSIALPDKTYFCNDSCNVFLKESSEYLNSNLQAQRSTPIQQQQPEPAKIHHPTIIATKIVKINSEEHDKTYMCTYTNCLKVYAKPAHLKAHLRRHVGDKPYICTWPNCTWKFSRSDELSRHRRSHSGIKPYKCTYCTKCFSRSDHLAKHRKVHERKMAKVKVAWASKNALLYRYPNTRPGRRTKNADEDQLV